MPTKPSKTIEVIPNPRLGQVSLVHMKCPEFTCLCPRTGQPDFATVDLTYVPGKTCIELKSLKLYLWSYRNEGIFHEAAAHTILEDLVRACKPRYMKVKLFFKVRGGIYTDVTVTHGERPVGLEGD